MVPGLVCPDSFDPERPGATELAELGAVDCPEPEWVVTLSRKASRCALRSPTGYALPDGVEPELELEDALDGALEELLEGELEGELEGALAGGLEAGFAACGTDCRLSVEVGFSGCLACGLSE